jgi:perosamine synthetase
MIQQAYKQSIASYLHTDPARISLYWKGRVALYSILKAMGVGKGDEVILPAYTCVVVPNAILYLGATPVYVDIQPGTYNASFESIQQAKTSRTKVVICQNTFGLSTQVEEIAAWAKQHQLNSIEDCTHGFGGTYNGKPNGSYCDAAFYSTQWNKPYSTGIGGFLLLNNTRLEASLNTVNTGLVKPRLKEVSMLSLLLFTKKYLLTATNYWRLVSIYRWLSKYNIVVGSSEGEEINGTSFPADYFKACSNVQALEGLKSIKKLDALIALRRSNAGVYNEFLKTHGKTAVPDELFRNHSFLKFPLLVKDRAAFEKKAQEEKIEITNWFCSPLHPIETGLERWLLHGHTCPTAVSIAAKMVNLPCDINGTGKVLTFLSHTLDLIA